MSLRGFFILMSFVGLALGTVVMTGIYHLVARYTAPKDLRVIYSQDPLPPWWQGGKRIFLAGPTWRPLPSGEERRTGWRLDAVDELRRAGFTGFVFVPEFADGRWSRWKAQWTAAHPGQDPAEQVVRWEAAALDAADVRFFWMPLTMPVPDNPSDTQLGFTARMEVGWWLHAAPRSVVVAFPCGADGSAFVRYHSKTRGARLLRDVTLPEALEVLR